MNFTEDIYEGSILDVIQELGYDYIPAENIERETYKDPLYGDKLYEGLSKVNPSLSLDIIDKAVFNLKNIDIGSLVQRNRYR